MQVKKCRKDSKTNREHSYTGKASQKSVNYQRGMIRNMCEETPKSNGNVDSSIWVTTNIFWVFPLENFHCIFANFAIDILLFFYVILKSMTNDLSWSTCILLFDSFLCLKLSFSMIGDKSLFYKFLFFPLRIFMLKFSNISGIDFKKFIFKPLIYSKHFDSIWIFD